MRFFNDASVPDLATRTGDFALACSGRMTGALKSHERGEVVLETGRTYDGVTPIRVRVTKRDRRYRYSDGGGAVAAAGVTPARVGFPESIPLGLRSVNVSRRGEVWLPGVERSGEEWLALLPELVAEGSLVLYETLLETFE